MSDLVKDTDPAVQLDNVMKSLHCYAADATALKEGDLDSLEVIIHTFFVENMVRSPGEAFDQLQKGI